MLGFMDAWGGKLCWTVTFLFLLERKNLERNRIISQGIALNVEAMYTSFTTFDQNKINT